MEISLHWRLREQRYNLTGTVCTECGKRFFTPRPVCDVCNAPVADEQALDLETIYRGSTVKVPAHR